MDNWELCESPLELALILCSVVCQIADNSKHFKSRCQQVVMRVKVLQGQVLTIKSKARGGISENVENALKELCSTLKSAKTLMEKVSQNKRLSGLMNFSTHYDQFSSVDERLINCFKVLSEAFQIDTGKNPMTMYPMEYNPAAPMPQPNMSSMAYNPTAPMPQPNMYPMEYNPAAPMPQPNMYPMEYNPAAPMPQPNMSPMAYNPTAPMPQPNMSPMAYNPTAPMPQPNMSPMAYNPAAPMPQPNMSPMPSLAMSNSISPLSSIPYFTPTDPYSATGMMAPTNVYGQTPSGVPSYGFLP